MHFKFTPEKYTKSSTKNKHRKSNEIISDYALRSIGINTASFSATPISSQTKHKQKKRRKRKVSEQNLQISLISRSNSPILDNPKDMSVASGENSGQDDIQNKMTTPSPESYISMIPYFDGKKESNIKNFLLQYDSVMETANLEPKAQLTILKAKLTGTARDRVMENDKVFNEKDLTSFKNKLREMFVPKFTFNEAEKTFTNIKQKPGQRMKDYVKEFNVAAEQYFSSTEQAGDQNQNKFIQRLKLNKFLETIHPSISLDLRKKFHNSFEEACAEAIKLDEVYTHIEFSEINTLQPTQMLQIQQTPQTYEEESLIDQLLKYQLDTNRQLNALAAKVNNLNLYENNAKYIPKQAEYYCKFCRNNRHTNPKCWKSEEYKAKYNKNNKQKQEETQTKQLADNTSATVPETNNANHHNWNYPQQYLMPQNGPQYPTYPTPYTPMPHCYDYPYNHYYDPALGASGYQDQHQFQRGRFQRGRNNYRGRNSRGKPLERGRQGPREEDKDKQEETPNNSTP